MARFIQNVSSGSRTTATEMAERLLASESEVALYKMLFWGAAGVVGATALITRAAWVRARNMRKRTIVALTKDEQKNRAKIETARCACLEWQIASIEDREELSKTNKQLARQKKESATTQAQLQLERSERLRLQMAYDQLKEQQSKTVEALKQEVGDFSVVTAAVLPLAYQALQMNLSQNEHRAKGLLPRQ